MKNSEITSFLLIAALLCLPTTAYIDLTSTTTNVSFKLTCGDSAGSKFGYSLASIGDINGDGVGDFAIGAPSYLSSVGMVAIIYGSSTGDFPTEICQVSDFTKFYKIVGTSSETFGTSIAGVGDINGDGVPDIAVGGPGYSSGKGRAVVIFLPKIAPTSDLSVSTYSSLYTLTGSTSEALGSAISAAGDVDGDGTPDILVGAPSNKRAYVLYGTTSSSYAATSTESNKDYYSVKSSVTVTNMGIAVSSYRDVNGDGVADFLVGTQANGFYLVYGKSGRLRSYVDTATSSEVFTIASTSDAIGVTFAIGDIDRDGILDIVSSNSYIGLAGNTIYVLYGSYIDTQLGSGSVFYVNSLTTSQGFKITDSLTTNGMPMGLGLAMCVGGDVNGDSLSDTVFAATNEASSKGSVYVRTDGANAAYDVNSFTVSQGYRINGYLSSGYLGISVISTVDINYDGVSDIIVSAALENSNQGGVYVIYGTCSATGYSKSNGVCCKNGLQGSNGHCCQSGYTYDKSSASCIISTTSTSVTTSSLSGGQIVGIILGAVFFFLLCAGIAAYLVHLKQNSDGKLSWYDKIGSRGRGGPTRYAVPALPTETTPIPIITSSKY